MDPSSLATASPIILSILKKEASNFKVVNAKEINRDIKNTKEKINDLNGHIKSLNKASNSDEIQEYIRAVREITNKPVHTKDDAIHILEDLEAKYEKSLKKSERFADGMQVTVYLPPKKTKQYTKILKRIEKELSNNDIKPGESYHTDKKIGNYTSIRHPGKKYQFGIDVQDYNPDKIADPFDSLLKDTEALNEKTLIFMNLLEQQIKQLENISDKCMYKELKAELKEELEQKFNTFKSYSDEQKNEIFPSFKKDVKGLIDKAASKLNKHNEFKNWRNHLILLVTVVGIPIALVSICIKLIKGSYFFENKQDVFSPQYKSSNKGVTVENITEKTYEGSNKISQMKDQLQEARRQEDLNNKDVADKGITEEVDEEIINGPKI